jgi:hypothetical protein
VHIKSKRKYFVNYKLYGKNGYFIKLDKGKCCGCSPQFVREFVQGCIKCSFFDERIFESFGALTSAGIQRRYVRMFNSCSKIRIILEYWLLDNGDEKDVPASVLNKLDFKNLPCTENPVKSTENPNKSTRNTQSRVNKSKLNHSKGKEKNLQNTAPATVPENYYKEKSKIKLIHPTLDEVRIFCKERGSPIDPEKFFKHYDYNGWLSGSGYPVRNWKSKVIDWENSQWP